MCKRMKAEGKRERERVFEWNYLAHPSPKGDTRLLSDT